MPLSLFDFLSEFLTNFNICNYRTITVFDALQNHFNFIEKAFLPIVARLNASQFSVSKVFLGSMFGKNRSKELQKFEIKSYSNQSTVASFISTALKLLEACSRFVSFFVV